MNMMSMTVARKNYLKLAVAVLAPVVNSIELLPQLVTTFYRKHVRDLSLLTILLLLLANVLWFMHGYYISDNSLMIGGAISLAINSALLGLYFLYS